MEDGRSRIRGGRWKKEEKEKEDKEEGKPLKTLRGENREKT